MAVGDLTTLANVRAYLQKQTGDTDQDALINALIPRASRAVCDHTNCEFSLPTAATAHVFVWRGGPLSTVPYPLQTLSAVSLDTDGTTPTAVAATDWRLRPKPAKFDVYWQVALPGNGVAHGLEREVTLTGIWGFLTVPSAVEEACIETIVTWLRSDIAALSTTFQVDEQRLERPEGIPVAAARKLAPYVRMAGF